MRLTTFATALFLSLAVAGGASATATQCKDPHGKFTRCPPAAGAATSSAVATPSPAPARPGRCKGPTGRFIKCPAPAGSAVATAPAAAPAPPKPPQTTSTTHAASSIATTTRSALVMSAGGAPAGATAKCRDGTYSMSQHHSGTCSHHGGVAAWLQ